MNINNLANTLLEQCMALTCGSSEGKWPPKITIERYEYGGSELKQFKQGEIIWEASAKGYVSGSSDITASVGYGRAVETALQNLLVDLTKSLKSRIESLENEAVRAAERVERHKKMVPQ